VATFSVPLPAHCFTPQPQILTGKRDYVRLKVQRPGDVYEGWADIFLGGRECQSGGGNRETPAAKTTGTDFSRTGWGKMIQQYDLSWNRICPIHSWVPVIINCEIKKKPA
jgi:hypothetical protein